MTGTGPKNPLLSFVIPGRNDDFMGNFRWRFETSLNYLADNLLRTGKLEQAEIIVCDWGSKVPLYQSLTLGAAARKLVRFVLVPEQLTCQLQKDSDFPVVFAYNIGVRRARGKFIAQTDSDILFTAKALGLLFGVLEGERGLSTPLPETFFYAWRRMVPCRYVLSSPRVEELDWLVCNCAKLLPLYSDFNRKFCNTGFVLMHRNLWEESSGFDERLIYWGWMETDLGLRMSRRYPTFNMYKLGMELFHLEHYQRQLRRLTSRKCNRQEQENVFCPGGKDWGLAGFEFMEYVFVQPGPMPPACPPRTMLLPGPGMVLALFDAIAESALRSLKNACAGLQHYCVRGLQICRDKIVNLCRQV